MREDFNIDPVLAGEFSYVPCPLVRRIQTLDRISVQPTPREEAE
jgi:hypothetical protein